MKTKRQQKNALDASIEQAVYRDCHGLPINIMDIGKVFAAGREAHARGEDAGAAAVQRYRELATGPQRRT